MYLSLCFSLYFYAASAVASTNKEKRKSCGRRAMNEPHLFISLGAAGGGVRISCSGDSSKPPTIAEEAVDQLQENEKLVAGNTSSIN